MGIDSLWSQPLVVIRGTAVLTLAYFFQPLKVAVWVWKNCSYRDPTLLTLHRFANRASGPKADLYDSLVFRKQMGVAPKLLHTLPNRSNWLISMLNDIIGRSCSGNPLGK